MNTRSSLDTQVFFESFELAGKTLGNKAKALANDSHFSEVVLARLEGKVFRAADDDQYQIWDAKVCQWAVGKTQDVYAIVKKELVTIWAPKHIAGPGEETKCYPLPLVETSFINRIKDLLYLWCMCGVCLCLIKRSRVVYVILTYFCICK